VARPGDLPPELAWAPTPGLLFPWRSLDGRVVWQYRPDEPNGNAKYLFPKGSRPPIWVPRPPGDAHTRLLCVEGTKQTLHALTWAPPGTLVAGIAGCWGWSHDGIPDPDLDQLAAGREVVVAMDADIASSPQVHEAAKRLGEHLAAVGAASVRFLRLPAGGKAGLDDYLAGRADPAGALARLIERAAKLPARPKAKAEPGDLWDDSGLRVAALFDRITAEHHLALDHSGRIAVYADGVYRADWRNEHAFCAIVAGLLGNRYRAGLARSAEEFTAARLLAAGAVIPPEPATTLVNLANGMLDPFTGELHPHDPAHLSAEQLPVAWDPAATCPAFDRWLADAAGALAEDLLEAAAQVLERRPGRQRKAIVLYGPARSGKSTFLRLLGRLAGPHHSSAVTLHELATDPFAAADLAGSLLNCAADLSAAHVEDLARFKALTGDDMVRAQRKYGQPFTFRARCLFAFSANAVPTVSEASTAYLARIRPYRFTNSYEGHEDPGIEDKLSAELPGILVLLVGAYQRFNLRGGYADTGATRAAAEHFAYSSDRVRLFLAEACTIEPSASTSRGDLAAAFDRWCDLNHRRPMSRAKLWEFVRSAGLDPDRKVQGVRVVVGVTLRPDDDWGADEPPASRARRFSVGSDPSAPDGGSEGQKGQPARTSLSRARKRAGDENPRARENRPGSDPSAPDEASGPAPDDDPGYEDFPPPRPRRATATCTICGQPCRPEHNPHPTCEHPPDGPGPGGRP
jgi:putative DNA primase/helicase